MRYNVIGEIAATSLKLTYYLVIVWPFDLIYDVYFFGTLQRVNIEIADLMRLKIFNSTNSSLHMDIDQGASVEKNFLNNHCQHIIINKFIAESLINYIPETKPLFLSIKKGINFIESKVNILKIELDQNGILNSVIDTYENAHLEAHIIEIFEPFYDILLLNETKEDCLKKITEENDETFEFINDYFFQLYSIPKQAIDYFFNE